VTVSGDSVDHLRIAELEGSAKPEGLMLRSTSTRTDPLRSGGSRRRFTVVFPQLTFVNNSELPFGTNDGALWAGVGANARVLGGLTASVGPLRLVVIPEWVYSANNRLSIDPNNPKYLPFALLPTRSRFSNPWNVRPYSIDMPWRFGDAPINKLYPGQSSISVTAGPVELGGASENEWWGPALQNPIVMGDNAAGFPHLFLRSSHPLDTKIGRIDARWIVGALHESDFFDTNPLNDVRTISAAAIAWKRSAESGLTLGLMRSVFSVATRTLDAPSHAFDFLANVGHPNARALSDTAEPPGKDQIISLFARWALPRYGLETYVEWGRAEMPISLHDFLVMPNHTRGYTSGVQWARAIGRDIHFRVQGEVTNVEQSATWAFRPIGSFYTSRAVQQGYTNEGQLLATGIGPGSNGQWIASDIFKGGWQLGVSGGRIRFNNDAFFLLSAVRKFALYCGHDVTTYPGIRTGYSNSYFRIRADYAWATRYDTFFENKVQCSSPGEGSDRYNHNLSVTLATFGW